MRSLDKYMYSLQWSIYVLPSAFARYNVQVCHYPQPPTRAYPLCAHGVRSAMNIVLMLLLGSYWVESYFEGTAGKQIVENDYTRVNRNWTNTDVILCGRVNLLGTNISNLCRPTWSCRLHLNHSDHHLHQWLLYFYNYIKIIISYIIQLVAYCRKDV